MSVDSLQEKIRKRKNPSVVLIEAIPDWLPPHLLQQEGDFANAFSYFCRQLLGGLKETVPAVRFGLGSFAMLGQDGMKVLCEAMTLAKELGYYVLMDLPELLTPASANHAVTMVENFPCDGVIAGSYLGSDVLSQLRKLCGQGKTVFAVCRTANRSAVELQDLLTGGRLVHTAAADVVWRYAEPEVGKCGYSQFGAVAAASSVQSIQTLRSKFPRIFLLLDGFDYANANAKNCSAAFDRFGHGAAACAASSVVAAWREAQTDGANYVDQAVQAAERMKKNLTRYITIL